MNVLTVIIRKSNDEMVGVFTRKQWEHLLRIDVFRGCTFDIYDGYCDPRFVDRERLKYGIDV